MNIVEEKFTNFKRHIKESVERIGKRLSDENCRDLYETKYEEFVVRLTGYINLGYTPDRMLDLLAEAGGYKISEFKADDHTKATRYIEYFTKIIGAAKVAQ